MFDPRYAVAVAIALAFGLAAVAARAVHVFVRRTLHALDIDRAERDARARQLTRAVTALAYGVAAFASIAFALARFGFGEPRWDLQLLGAWVLAHGFNVAIIVVGAYVVTRAANLAVEHLQHKIGRQHDRVDLEWQRRTATIGSVIGKLLTVSVVFLAGLMLLRELSIDVLPLLTGAGIAGLAIGFGAQNLVRDVISGFFLILEDQVRVGDNARINGVAGIIEEINLRTIVLRDTEGAVQVFPNGTITALANLSKQYAYAIVQVRVAYSENLDRVLGTIRDVGETMRQDAGWSALVLEPLEIAGVESLADGAATIGMKFKTQPLNQGRVANELRQRLLTMFVRRGIRPYATL